MRGNCNICIIGKVFIQAFGFFKLQNYVKINHNNWKREEKQKRADNSITSNIQQRQIVPPWSFWWMSCETAKLQKTFLGGKKIQSYFSWRVLLLSLLRCVWGGEKQQPRSRSTVFNGKYKIQSQASHFSLPYLRGCQVFQSKACTWFLGVNNMSYGIFNFSISVLE